MKLTSEDLRTLIASRVANVATLSFDPAEIPLAVAPKAWKRHSKMRVFAAVANFGATGIPHFLEMGDGTDILNAQPVTDLCMVRHFVLADLTLDCMVVSDEADQNVLAMVWHRD